VLKTDSKKIIGFFTLLKNFEKGVKPFVFFEQVLENDTNQIQ